MKQSQERLLLAAVQREPQVLDEVHDLVLPDHFESKEHAELWAAMLDARKDGLAYDPLSVGLGLGEGYRALVATLVDLAEFTNPSNARAYGMSVVRQWKAREVKRIATALAEKSESERLEIEVLSTETALREVMSVGASGGFVKAAKVLQGTMESVNARYEQGGDPRAIKTGIYDLDRLTGGLHPSHMVLIGGRPGMGKTALAMNIAAHVADDPRNTGAVGVFSFEMKSEELMLRLIASVARVDSRALSDGKLLSGDWHDVFNAASRIGSWPLYLDDSSPAHISAIASSCRDLKEKKGLTLLIIDYLQLMHAPPGARGESREAEVSEISGACKRLAKELDVPVLALSQLNRAGAGRADKRPQLSDLRNSGALEQDADQIIFVHRPVEDPSDQKESTAPRMSEIILEKNRHGPTGTVQALFFPAYVRFDNSAEER